jgi:hypothetical protein
MAKRDQDQIRRALAAVRREPLPSYTDDVEDSVVKHVEALKRRQDEGGSTANLVVDTLTRTLDGLPSNDRIWFVLALFALAALAMGSYVTLKVTGVW